MATGQAQQDELYNLGVQARQSAASAAQQDLANQLKNLESQTAWSQEDAARTRGEQMQRLPENLQTIGSGFAARGSYYSGARGTAQGNYETDLRRQLDDMQRTADRQGYQRYLQANQARAETARTLEELGRQNRVAELQKQLSEMSGGGGGGYSGGYGGGSLNLSKYEPIAFNGTIFGAQVAAQYDPLYANQIRGGDAYADNMSKINEFLSAKGDASDAEIFNFLAGSLAQSQGISFSAAKNYLGGKNPTKTNYLPSIGQALYDSRVGFYGGTVPQGTPGGRAPSLEKRTPQKKTPDPIPVSSGFGGNAVGGGQLEGLQY